MSFVGAIVSETFCDLNQPKAIACAGVLPGALFDGVMRDGDFACAGGCY
jgi:hypothetical protein